MTRSRVGWLFALAEFKVMYEDREGGVMLLRQLAREHPHNAQLRLGLLKLAEIQTDTTTALTPIDELKKSEGDNGLR